MRLTPMQRAAIVDLRSTGLNVTDIAKRIGVARITVRLWLRRHEDEGHVKQRPARQQKTATNAEQDAAILAAHTADPLTPTRETAERFNVSVVTVRRRLQAMGVRYGRRALEPLPATEENRKREEERKSLNVKHEQSPDAGELKIDYDSDGSTGGPDTAPSESPAGPSGLAGPWDLAGSSGLPGPSGVAGSSGQLPGSWGLSARPSELSAVTELFPASSSAGSSHNKKSPLFAQAKRVKLERESDTLRMHIPARIEKVGKKTKAIQEKDRRKLDKEDKILQKAEEKRRQKDNNEYMRFITKLWPNYANMPGKRQRMFKQTAIMLLNELLDEQEAELEVMGC